MPRATCCTYRAGRNRELPPGATAVARTSIAATLAAALLSMLLGGCATAPHSSGPPPVATAPADAQSGWWRALGSAELDQLVETALAHHPDLHAAQARVRQAVALRNHEQAQRRPELSLGGGASRSRAMATRQHADEGQGYRTPADLRSQFDLAARLRWDLDLAGRLGLSVQAAQAELEAARQDAAQAQRLLVLEVVRAWSEARTARAQQALAQASLQQARGTAQSVDRRLAAGLATLAEGRQARDDASQVAGVVADLAQEQAMASARLAALTARWPGPESTEKPLEPAAPPPGSSSAHAATSPALLGTLPGPPLPYPTTAPSGDPAVEVLHASLALPVLHRPTLPAPSALKPDGIDHRPDVQAAWQRLTASEHDSVRARLERRPTLAFNADLGLASEALARWLRGDALTWALGAALQMPLLDAGRAQARMDESQARRDEREALYRWTVLRAWQDVREAQATLEGARARQAEAEAEAARRATDLDEARRRRSAGLETRIGQAQALRASLSADAAAMQRAHESLMAWASLQQALGR